MIEFDDTYIQKFQSLIDVGKLQVPSEPEIQETLKKIKELAKTGWMLPIEETPEEHWEFLNNRHDIVKLDDLFRHYFNDDDCKKINNLYERILENKSINKFKSLYEQALFLFKNKFYSGSLIILSVIYEGIIRNFIQYNDNTGVSSNINKCLNDMYKNKITIIFQDREAIKIFTEEFFKKTDFNNVNDSNYFNRNILLHGIDYTYVTNLDVIKLFNAIDVLVSLIADYEYLLKELSVND